MCACCFWIDELLLLNLWVEPLLRDEDATGQSHEETGAFDESAAPVDAYAGVVTLPRGSIQRVAELLSVSRYSSRWPRMPYIELCATSVSHPFCKDAEGSPVRLLLDTKVFGLSDDNCSGLARDGTLVPDINGDFPFLPCCYDCCYNLCAAVPRLPKCALANDNLMLREPSVFRTEGKRLSTIPIAMLSLARMVVRKIIAEPYKKNDPSFKQKGLRSNTIAFPQARCRELITQALPAEPSVAAEYFADTISIALTGADPSDLEHAKWAQAPRGLHDCRPLLRCTL